MPDVIIVQEPQTIIVEETPDVSILETDGEPVIIEVGVAGPQGPLGPPGPEGPQGQPGAASGSYRHVQAIAASTWTIVHNLGAFLNVTVVNSANEVVEGDIQYIDMNTITVTFSGAFSGEAYVS